MYYDFITQYIDLFFVVVAVEKREAFALQKLLRLFDKTGGIFEISTSEILTKR